VDECKPLVAGADVATLGLGPAAPPPPEQLPSLVTALVCHGMFTAGAYTRSLPSST